MGGLSSLAGVAGRSHRRIWRMVTVATLVLLFVGAFVPWSRTYYTENLGAVFVVLYASIVSLARSNAKSKRPNDDTI